MSSRPLAAPAPAPAAQVAEPLPSAPIDALASSQSFADLHTRLVAAGYVEYRPVLAELLGSPKPALMLGHALYWTRTWLRQQPQREGWFWKTAHEWREAVGMSTREQESARQALRDSGVWSEALQGSPARLFFRVNVDALCSKLGLTPDDAADDKMRFDKLATLLGQPIMFFRPLADIAGGVIGGLVLSHLLNRYRAALNRKGVDALGFFTADVEDARIALSLGPKAQRNAREALRKAGLMQEGWTQEKRSRLMVRLNMQAILACVCGQERPQRPNRRGTSSGRPTLPEAVPVQQSLLPDRARVVSQDGNVTRVTRLLLAAGAKEGAKRRLLLDTVETTQIGGISQSSPALLLKQQGLSDVKGGPFVETRAALLSKLYTKLFSSNTTTEQKPAAGPSGQQRSSSSMDLPFTRSSEQASTTDAPEASLIVPDRLDPLLHAGAMSIVERAPLELRQSLLDELSGRLSASARPLNNPLGWLASVTERASAGGFVLALAPQVAAARQARRDLEHRHPASPDAIGASSLDVVAPTPTALKSIQALRQLSRRPAKGEQE